MANSNTATTDKECNVSKGNVKTAPSVVKSSPNDAAKKDAGNCSATLYDIARRFDRNQTHVVLSPLSSIKN